MLESGLLTHIGSYVDGRWVTDAEFGTAPVRNPANGDLLAEVPLAGEELARSAVACADRTWKHEVQLSDRRGWLAEIAGLLRSHADELGRIITLENGKPIRESIAEVEYAAGFFRFFADNTDALLPNDLPTTSRGCGWRVHHRPLGVVGLITPWNFPLAMLAKKLAPALAGGNGVVTKPASETPLTAIALYRLLEQVDIPSGLNNLVVGPAEPIAAVLCDEPRVRLISFTGSTEVGRILAAQCAPGVKRLALELGGNAPFIVFDDADVEHAASEFVANKFRASGQTCVCANRVIVQSGIEVAFVGALSEKLATLTVGPGIDASTDIGPLINLAGFDKVAEHLADACGQGAELAFGKLPERPGEDWGCYFPPVLIRNVREGMKVLEEETFGPLVAVSSFETEDEAVERANATPFGLAAYVFGKDSEQTARVISQLRFGHVGCNTGTGPTPEAPFGGMKQSGYGREGGLEGLLEFTESQTVATPH